MDEQMYIIVGMTDAGAYIEALTKAELELRLTSDFYGDRMTFMTKIPDVALDLWPMNTALIVRASAFVMPQIGVAMRCTVD